MDAAADKKRALRLEWEHIMPAENFGRQFACWRVPLCHHANGTPYKGRACCEKIEPRFRQAEAELYNLWPEVGLLNQLRSNYRYAELPGKPKTYGCEFYVDSATRRIEPADAVKGLVARANLFMADRYGIALSSAQQQLFVAWHRQFPPSAWEKEWASQVAAIEGYSNPWIESSTK
ncbi:deoxyribonuclease-1 [Legionella quinlivanii DSM 21216]|nr:deoxyribonuclease-1 [Legionella quinlivanii DSM 21216]